MPVREKGRRSPGSQPARPFSCPSHPQTAAKVWGFSPIASGFTAETDWLLEGGVSCELVSENAKFPASREDTGNFIDSGLGGASEAAKKGMKSVPYGPIPYAST